MSASTNSSGSGSNFVPPSTEDLNAVLEQYEFLEILGRGGMGAVYKARQISLDRIVAIKILPAALAAEDEEDDFQFAGRFQREARAMAKLNHPNIIGVFDFGATSDEQYYIVMEYIEGTDLQALIRTGGLTTDHVVGWTTQICEALQYAHGQGIEALSTLRSLRELEFWAAPLEDAALEKIADFDSLKTVNLNRTAVSSEAVATLRAARPDLLVRRDN